MALTFTEGKQGVIGDVRYWAGIITFDGVYPVAGEAVVASDFGFENTIVHVIPGTPGVADEALVSVQWDSAASTLIARVADGTNEGDATDLAATVVAVFAIGT